MVGLGVMGRNLMLNKANHGFSMTDCDKDPSYIGYIVIRRRRRILKIHDIWNNTGRKAGAKAQLLGRIGVNNHVTDGWQE